MLTTPYDLCDLLRRNPYPGRGIMLGNSPDPKETVALYFIMGRSVNSRNRFFQLEGNNLRIEIFDRELVKDPSLILYRPLREWQKNLILTNGDQTDTIFDALKGGDSFEAALRTRCFEPDKPHFTPRISGLLDTGTGDYKLSILKAADTKGAACQRFFFDFEAKEGLGHFLHTYQADNDPLPSFNGEPRCVEIPDDLEAFARDIWDSLDSANRVALYLRGQSREGKVNILSIHNRHTR